MSDDSPLTRVVLDSQVWLRGLLTKDPDGDAVGPTILRAARRGYFKCIGSSALVYELAEKIRLPRIARKLAPSQGAEFLSLAIALMDPLVPIDGDRIGCVDPNDDHLLEAALKGGATFVVSRDPDLLEDLPKDVNLLLKLRDVCPISDDEFCGVIRKASGPFVRG